MELQELRKRISENGSASAVLLMHVLDIALSEKEDTGAIGELSELETDHKSDIVAAINELVGIVEKSTMVVSFEKTRAELASIYAECALMPELAKNIVFLSSDGMHYVVNGYKFAGSVLTLHTIMQDGNALGSRVINLAQNGTLFVG